MEEFPACEKVRGTQVPLEPASGAASFLQNAVAMLLKLGT